MVFTPAGGRLPGLDPVDLIPQELRPRVERSISQAAFAVSRASEGFQPDPKIRLWAASCRKVLQRGTRPQVSPRSNAVIRTRLADSAIPMDDPRWAAGLVRAAGASPSSTQLDSSYSLHPTYEQPFWERLHDVAPGLERWLLPQAPLDSLVETRGRKPSAQFVDFLYCPPWLSKAMVLEIDGCANHPVKSSDVDADRDRRSWSARLAVRRLGGLEILRSDGPVLTGMRREYENKWQSDDDVDPAHLVGLHAASVPARLGLAIVEAVVRGHLLPDRPWTIAIHDPTLQIAEALLGSVLDVLWAVSDIWSLGVVPDEVGVGSSVWQLSADGTDSRPVRRSAADPGLEITLEPTRAYWEALPTGRAAAQVVVRGVGVPVDLAWLPTSMPGRIKIPKSAAVDRSLRLLATDIFGYPDFRAGQLPAIRQMLAGEDSLVLLPTGSGKSLIYQVAGLVQPGTTMVIDPLISLIDDQAERLAAVGVDRVAALHAARLEGSDTKAAAFDAVASGDALFVFATPERMQSARFREHLRTAADQQLINAVVVDESHCVSEWGHDFRTSYLRLADNLRRLCSDRRGRPPPLVALTGTASPAVFRDAVRELAIDPEADGAIQRPDSHDRPNLEYRVLTGPEQTWLSLVLQGVTEVVPRELSVPLGALAEPRGSQTLSGIVFTPHAQGEHGVEHVRDAIVGWFVDRDQEIGVDIYAGQGPDGSEDRWAEERRAAACRFKSNATPLLVATKAFGMGIDKPNIRYTVHAGIPSSIEAYAQEAGRAGRDGERSICVLTAVVPTDELRAKVLDPDLDAQGRKLVAREIGRDKLGDVDRQLFLLGNSFPGVDQEVGEGAVMLDRLLERVGSSGGMWKFPMERGRPKDKQERRKMEDRRRARDRALYRLGLLGVVDDLTFDAGEMTVHMAPYSQDLLDVAFVEHLDRIEPGRADSHRGLVHEAPDEPRERVLHHLQAVVESVYRIVYRSRVNALDSMVSMAIRHQEPSAIRSYINSYLGSGPAAAVLANAIVAETVDVPRFIQRLAALADADQDELAPQAARQAEAYPDHPIVLLASAIGEARLPEGDEARFVTSLQRSLAQMREYGVTPDDAAGGIRWTIRQLRSAHGGRRKSWALRTMEAWEASGYPDDLLAPIENEILDDARQGRYRIVELRAVSRRRTIRGARTAKETADRLVGVATGAPEELTHD